MSKRYLNRLSASILVVATGCAGAKQRGTNAKTPMPPTISKAISNDIDINTDKSQAPAQSASLNNPDAPSLALQEATILTAAGQRYQAGTLLLSMGSIEYVGPAKPTPAGYKHIALPGKTITPGLIDTHSHIGVYSLPRVEANNDGNEMVAANTAEARVAYGYNPQDPSITRARAGGVTTALVLPGSANLIGGQGQSVVMKPGRDVREVMFPGAPRALKMACGENPKRVYSEKGGPQTRMAEYARFRSIFHSAKDYNKKQQVYADKHKKWMDEQGDPDKKPEPPTIDLRLEALAATLRGEVMVQVHCYKASEMAEMLAIANEFGFKVRSFHHALEAYKIRDQITEAGTAISTWADWWGFKMEAFDAIPQNAALFAEQGGKTVIHSDSEVGIQRLNQEAAKAMASGKAAGINIDDNEALRWITANAAWVLGIDNVVGTLEQGKRADVVVWSGHPFSVYSVAEQVFQAGELTFERNQGIQPTDYELGHGANDL